MLRLFWKFNFKELLNLDEPFVKNNTFVSFIKKTYVKLYNLVSLKM